VDKEDIKENCDSESERSIRNDELNSIISGKFRLLIYKLKIPVAKILVIIMSSVKIELKVLYVAMTLKN